MGDIAYVITIPSDGTGKETVGSAMSTIQSFTPKTLTGLINQKLEEAGSTRTVVVTNLVVPTMEMVSITSTTTTEEEDYVDYEAHAHGLSAVSWKLSVAV